MGLAGNDRDSRGTHQNEQGIQLLADRSTGTPYEGDFNDWQRMLYDKGPGTNPLNFTYGHSFGGADAAVQQAQDLAAGAMANGQGQQAYGLQQSAAAQGRSAPSMLGGQWGAQNAALASAGGYGGSLANLEAQQGPSAAQSQLMAGNNAAMAQQMALARSGRGFGGNAAAMGQAQGNMAQLGAQNANQAAMLRAQEDAAWRQRQAGNLQSAAGISLGRGQQLAGQQQADMGARQANLNAQLQSTAQNDQAALGWAGYGQNAYGQGATLGLGSQSLQNQIRGQQMQGDQALSEQMMRAWAAKNGYALAEQQRQDQQNAGLIQAGASLVGSLF